MASVSSKQQIFFFIISVCFLANIYAESGRGSSAPYISGDSFRALANFVFDEESRSLMPTKVRFGDIIFVKIDLLDDFIASYHSRINQPYILITHNGDLPVTDKYKGYLDNDNVIIWFAQNITNFTHPKLKGIPIGIANRCWPHGNVQKLKEARSLFQNCNKEHLLYMNFSIGTYSDERSYVYNLFRQLNGGVYSCSKDFFSYLTDLARTKFVISPRGNGIDTHRTWEALYMGAVPVVKSSSLDPLFKDLPVLIVDDWNIIDESYLEKKWDEFKDREYNYEKLYINYWEKEISKYKRGFVVK